MTYKAYARKGILFLVNYLTSNLWRNDVALEKAVLDNGLTIYNDHMPGELTNSVTMYVPYGSVDEKPGDEGSAHAFEHCVFLKTDKFANEVAVESHAHLNGIDANAATDYTSTLYYADGLRIEPSIVHLSQILQHTHLPERDVKHAMKAVRREAMEILDDSDTLHSTAADFAMFGAPYGRDIIGFHDKLNFGAEKLQKLHERYYKLGRMTLVTGGMVTMEEVVAAVSRHFTADATPYDDVHTKQLDVTLGEQTSTGLLIKSSQNTIVNVAYPLTPEFQEQRNKNKLAIDVARYAISQASFRTLRYDKGISYNGGVSFNTFNHKNAYSLVGSVTTGRDNIPTAKKVFNEIFKKDDSAYSDEELKGCLEMFSFAYRRDLTSIESRMEDHVNQLRQGHDLRDVTEIVDELDRLNIAEIRAAINQIVAFTNTSTQYTHVSGDKKAMRTVDEVIELSNII